MKVFFSKVAMGVLSLGALATAYLPGEDRYPSLPHSAGLSGNPATLAAFDSPGWQFAYDQNAQETNSLRTGFHGEEWGAAFRWLDGPSGYDWSEWSIVGSTPNENRSFFTGSRLAIVRTSADNDNSYAWTPGLLWRPVSLLALGYSSTALLQYGPYQNRIQRLGASLRPHRLATLSWNAEARNLQDIRHFGSRVGQSLLAEIGIAGLDFGLTIPVVDPDDELRYALQVSMPLGPYHNIAVNGRRRNDQLAIQGFSVGGHSSRATHIWKQRRIIRVPLGGRIAEIEPGFSFFGTDAVGLGTLRNHFAHLQADPGADPIVFDFSGYSGGPAAAQEIRRGILGLRGEGKKTIAYIDDLRPSVLMAASAADRVVLQPSARVAFRGISSEVMYYKGLLDWVGIRAEMLRHGRYKSAIEPYTADSMSTEARSNLGGLLNGWWNIFRDSIAVSRGLSPAALDSFAANPGITAHAAYTAGLADTVLYLDEIGAYALQDFFKIQADPLMSDWTPTAENQFTEDWSPRPRIAVLHIDGTIIDGHGGLDRLTGTSAAGADDLMAIVDALRKEGGYEALILRINSPGGSALASDEVWHRLRSLAKDGMPIIASIGDMAASGGYYIACAADDIVAEPTSIVGSIGIFGGKVDLSGLLAKLKLRNEVVSTHPSASAESPARGFSESEKIALQNYMDEFYGRFVKIVADARGKDSLAIDSLGEGRVFTAAEALGNGLVDELGGMAKAIAVAKNRAGIASNSPVEVVPLQGEGPYSFRSLADQARILPWRAAIEGTQLWMLWTPGMGLVE